MSANNTKRPVYLNLLRIRLPVGGVVSILHRVTGVALVLLLPLLLYILQQSLANASAYAQVVAVLGAPVGCVIVFIVILLLAHHFFAGIRHLLLDLDIAISSRAARRGAWLVLLSVAIVAAVAAASLLK